MKLKTNFHIHSQHSCDSACAKILDIIKEMEEMGFEEYGLTDHLHTSYNLPDIISARRDFLASCPPEHFHFGIEVSVVEEQRKAMFPSRISPPFPERKRNSKSSRVNRRESEKYQLQVSSCKLQV